MSSHETHNHPNTPAARAKCRRSNSRERVIKPTPIELGPDPRLPVIVTGTPIWPAGERPLSALELSRREYIDDAEYLGGLGDDFDPDMQAYVQVIEFDPTISHATYIPTIETHCSQCGTFDYESLETGDQGYTACCNEPQCAGVANRTYVWTDHSEPITSTKRTGTINACCHARISLPHDMITAELA